MNLFDSVYRSLGFERLVNWDGLDDSCVGRKEWAEGVCCLWAKRSSRLDFFFFPLSFPGGRQETFLRAVSGRIFRR